MPRRALAVLVAVVAFAATAAPTLGAAGDRHAALRLVRLLPVTVHGSGFKARERVRVIAQAGTSSLARTVVAGRAGAFDVTFPGMRVGHCGRLSILARGAGGSRATVSGHRGVADCNPA